MDRIGGRFGAHDDAHDDAGSDGPDAFDHYEETTPEAPLSPVGQDERRMQVRAYNHWASLLGPGNFPDIAELKPDTLEDFGPYGVLLDFGGKRGMDDPAIRFLGARLAEECGAQAQFKRLSDVPGRSLLSRITDHYLQILANQAPIGFEAEFVNQRGAAVLYRGILLPWSSDGETIDFIFGVINWKETADAATADALLSAIDAALEAPAAPQPRHEGNHAMDRIHTLNGFAGDESDGRSALDGDDGRRALPAPAFGAAARSGVEAPFELVDEADDDETAEDEDAGEYTEWGAGFAGFGEDEAVYSVDYGDQGLEDGESGDDVDGVVDPLADESVGLGLAALVSRGARSKQGVVLPGLSFDDDVPESAAASTLPQAYEPPFSSAQFPVAEPLNDDAFELVEAYEEGSVETDAESEPGPADESGTGGDDDLFGLAAPVVSGEEPEGLYDCLAAARELAQTARSSEDRGRKALYQAVSRAYDFSLEAAASPEDFDELLADNGLTAQDRAPMTPIVKLVFGADYDKTRLTEYATVLGYAHRTGVARGALGRVLAEAEGGLKAIVQAERRARKGGEEAVEIGKGVRPSLAKKLRNLDASTLDDLPAEGPEFALVMVRRLPAGEVVVLGEVPEDAPLLERSARRLLA